MCISLSKLHANFNAVSGTLVSDTLKKVRFFKTSPDKQFERIKIPIVKKDSEKVFWTLPALAWNNYDKTQVGLLFGVDIDSLLKIRVTPMYGIGSKNLTGILNSTFFIAQKKKFPLSLSLNAKRFSYLLFPEDLTFNTLKPSVQMQLVRKSSQQFSVKVSHQSVWQEYILQGRQTSYFSLTNLVTDFTLQHGKFNYLNEAKLQFGKQFGVLNIDNKLKVTYNTKSNNGFYADLFAGLFLFNKIPSTNINAPRPVFMLGGTPNIGIYWLQKDYAFNAFYLDRNGQDNFFRHQTVDSDGGFNSMTNLGNTNQAMLALNLKSDVMLPEKVKRVFNIQAYVNGAYAKNRTVKGDFYAEAGASLHFMSDVISVYIPFVTTTNIQENQSSIFGITQREWTKRITFSVNLLKLKATYDK